MVDLVVDGRVTQLIPYSLLHGSILSEDLRFEKRVESKLIPTIAALRRTAKLQALSEWEQIWLADPRRNPAYRALHHPPQARPPNSCPGSQALPGQFFALPFDSLLSTHSQGNTMPYIAHEPWIPMTANAGKLRCRQQTTSSSTAPYSTTLGRGSSAPPPRHS
jgi:hypothetical protein